MADLILNVSFAPSERLRGQEPGNRKHKRFVQRRRLLERRGVLRQKQLPSNPLPQAGKGPRKKPAVGGKKRRRRRKEEEEKTTPQGSTLRPDGNAAARDPPRAAKSGHRALEKPKPSPGASPAPSKMVALDCEMVGTGPGGRTSDLARCSIVSYDGDVLYDRYVRPAAPIVDFRTRWSGIRRQHMAGAVPFCRARPEILRILSGKVVVGHAINNDFKALKYFHPKALTRDTSRIPLLNRRGGFPENVSISLKRLTKELLHRDIQVGKSGHSSVEDARATMELYKVVEAEWEQHLLLNPEQE